LRKTNQRLNKRCQRLEHLIAKYRRRYVAVQKPARYAQELAEDFLMRAREIYKQEVRDEGYNSQCLVCRLWHWWRGWRQHVGDDR